MKRSKSAQTLIEENLWISDRLVDRFAAANRYIDRNTREDWRQEARISVIRSVDLFLSKGETTTGRLSLQKSIYRNAKSRLVEMATAWAGYYGVLRSIDEVVGYSDGVDGDHIHRARSMNPSPDSHRGTYRPLQPGMVDAIGDVQTMLFAHVCRHHPYHEIDALERAVSRERTARIRLGYEDITRRRAVEMAPAA